MNTSAAKHGLTAEGLTAKANAEALALAIADRLRARQESMGLQPWRQWVSGQLDRMSPLLRQMVLAALKARAGR
tara:strand:+ start:134 stop:355 length:222 start_codon:yes stop_codon:yes gene_type:complete